MTWLDRIQSHLTHSLQRMQTSISSIVSPIVQSSFIRSNVKYIWSGLQQPFRLLHLGEVLVHSPETRQVLVQSLKENLIYYAAPVILFEGLIKPAIRTLPYGEDENLENTLKVVSNLIFMRIAMRLFINNSSYNACVSHVAANEIQKNLVGCDCSSIEKAKSSLTSPFYFLGNIVTTGLIGYIPRVGKMSNVLLNNLAYGQTLTEYKYAALGTCEQHRLRLLTANNAYCFGMGASFFLTTEFLYFLLSQLIKTESFFIYDAVFSLVFQYHILMAMLDEHPLPSHKAGLDFFYYPRLLVNALLVDSMNLLIPKLGNPQKRNAYNEMFDNVFNSKIANYLKRLLIEKEFLTMKTIVKTPAISLLIELKHKDFLKVLDKISQAQGYPLWMLDYVPSIFASENTFIMLKMFSEEGWKKFGVTAKNLMMEAVRSRETSEILYHKIENKLELIEEHVVEEKEESTITYSPETNLLALIKEDYLESNPQFEPRKSVVSQSPGFFANRKSSNGMGKLLAKAGCGLGKSR